MSNLIKLIKEILNSKLKNNHEENYPRGLVMGNDVRIRGNPRIQISDGAIIEIDNNVVLNSNPEGYHAGMSFPVTLTADNEDAKIKIGEQSRLHGCCIHAQSQITIGRKCLIASGAQIIDSNGHATEIEYARLRGNIRDIPMPILIGDYVWIGLNVIILKNVRIGEGCIITPNSVVISGDYPPFSMVGGNPAKVIKTYSSDAVYPEEILFDQLNLPRSRILRY